MNANLNSNSDNHITSTVLFNVDSSVLQPEQDSFKVLVLTSPTNRSPALFHPLQFRNPLREKAHFPYRIFSVNMLSGYVYRYERNFPCKYTHHTHFHSRKRCKFHPPVWVISDKRYPWDKSVVKTMWKKLRLSPAFPDDFILIYGICGLKSPFTNSQNLDSETQKSLKCRLPKEDLLAFPSWIILGPLTSDNVDTNIFEIIIDVIKTNN